MACNLSFAQFRKELAAKFFRLEPKFQGALHRKTRLGLRVPVPQVDETPDCFPNGLKSA
jgi:hypothetical protein